MKKAHVFFFNFSFNKAACIFLLFIVMGCAQKPVTDYNPERNFLALQTYAWSDKETNTGKNVLAHNALIDQRVHTSVDEALMASNFKKVGADKADFLMSYHLTMEEKTHPSSSVGIGFGGFNPGFMLGGSVAVNEYQETQLFIDMLDPHSLDLIWRGSVKYPTQNSLTPDKRTEEIRKKVTIILSAFPPR